VLQKPSPKLRILVVGKSKELAVSCGGISVLEQLVMVSKTRGSNTDKVEKMVFAEITQVVSTLFVFDTLRFNIYHLSRS
jgi:hypothetical protein